MIIAHQGSSAILYLKQQETAVKWDTLYQQCSWATAFQDRRYVNIWYELYQNKYIPLILVQNDGDQVTGIFPLAISPNGKIVGAGYPQAEYNVWLSVEAIQKSFFTDAIKWIRQQFPDRQIYLKYIPKNTPVEELQNDSFLKKFCIWHEYSQPVMNINEEFLNQELKKKNRKEKINRLKRMGELKFERLESYEVFDSLLDELIIQHDFRKGAMYGEEFFALDNLKKEFMQLLFKEGQLHVTLLWLNNEIIAANASMHGKGVVHLQGFNTHSPFYSKYSPGILRFLMLGLLMHKEGYYEFDLTPGGVDGYKTDLATDFYKTYELIISSTYQKAKIDFISHSKDFIKTHWPEKSRGFLKMDHVKQLKSDLVKKSVLMLKKGLKNYIQKKKLQEEPQLGFELYAINKPTAIVDNTAKRYLKKNSLADLLLFSDSESLVTRRRFLFDSMKRLEFGHQVYTFTDDQILQACVWYIPKDAKIEHPALNKSDSAVIFLSAYRIVSPEKLKELLTYAILNILQNSESIDVLFLKAPKKDPLINIGLLDHELFHSKLKVS